MTQHKTCYLCGKIILRSPDITIDWRESAKRNISLWYDLCINCIEKNDSILETFLEISDLPDNIRSPNHSIMFRLIEEIKNKAKI